MRILWAFLGRSAAARPRSKRAFSIRVGERPVVSPKDCACCGALASDSRSIGDGRGRYLLVGYCEQCAAHAASGATRRSAAWFSGVLLGGSLAAGASLAWPWLPSGAGSALAACGALLPPLLARLLERPRTGHVSAGSAVFFRSPGELVALREEWALALASELGVVAETSSGRSRFGSLVFASAALAALAAFALHRFHHPLVRILNLGDVTLEVFVDERRLGRVEPSSAESPRAGLELRLPAGPRSLAVRDLSGVVVAAAEVRLFSGKYHLYAPASPEVCFWLETRTYGRTTETERSPPLDGADRFWVLPAEIQGLFSAPPPAPADGPLRSTGGKSVVLRQGRCPAR